MVVDYFICVHGLFLTDTYNIYKTLSEEGKVNPMSNYEFLCLFCLANIDPINFVRRDYLVSAAQGQSIRKKGGVYIYYDCFRTEVDIK